MRRTDRLILGGGPAGAAAAIGFARAGHPVLMLERQRDDGDALCGGFLSWRTSATLEAIGLARAELGGHAIDTLRLFAGPHSGAVRLPAPATGLSRRRLDRLLRSIAENCCAAIERGVTVTHAAPGRVETADGATIACESLFLATGKHDCRGLARGAPTDPDPMLGLRLRLAPHPALTQIVGSAIELHLFAGGYAGLVLQEDGSGNLCMAVRKSRLKAAGGHPWALLKALAGDSPALGDRIAHAAPDAPIDAIAAIPYGWRAAVTVPGLFRLGDQAAVIPSLAGEGIGMALLSGLMAARRHSAGGAPAARAFQADTARASRWPLAVAGLVATAAGNATLRPLLPPLIAHVPGAAALIARLTRIGESPRPRY